MDGRLGAPEALLGGRLRWKDELLGGACAVCRKKVFRKRIYFCEALRV